MSVVFERISLWSQRKTILDVKVAQTYGINQIKQMGMRKQCIENCIHISVLHTIVL